jgi:hypothetical protein
MTHDQVEANMVGKRLAKEENDESGNSGGKEVEVTLAKGDSNLESGSSNPESDNCNPGGGGSRSVRRGTDMDGLQHGLHNPGRVSCANGRCCGVGVGC